MAQIGVSELDSGYKFLGIPSAEVDSLWYILTPMIDEALSYGVHTHTSEDIRKAIVATDFQLWIATNEEGKVSGCVVTEIQQHPSRRLLFVVLVAGEDAKAWMSGWYLIEQWARAHGCTGAITSPARKGIARLFSILGLEPIATVVGKDFVNEAVH